MFVTKEAAAHSDATVEEESQGRRSKTRNALLRAGEALMSTASADGVTIDDIVVAAKVAKGTFYNHFPDKESLQHEVLEVIRLDIKKVIAKYNAKIEDPARRLARAVCVLLLYSFSHRERAGFLARTLLSFRSPMDKANEGLVEDIGIGLAQGRLLIPTTESGVLLVLGISQAALARALEDKNSLASVARAQHLIAMMLRGFGLSIAEAELIAAQEADRVLRTAVTE